jgi:peptidoglycan hydrolase CwlO-like protein
MNKWIAIPIIIILVIGAGVLGYLYWQETDKLATANWKIEGLELNVSNLEANKATLEGNVSDLENNVSTLETNLSASEATAASLQSELETECCKTANLQEDLSAQRTINTSLTSELKLVKDPRHMATIQELTDWLQKDDTDTAYADESIAEKACILQVRALRDGYLLPAIIVDNGNAVNLAVIGDELWAINPDDDDTEFVGYVEPLPSHPLPLQ